jgi:hypothetical protein
VLLARFLKSILLELKVIKTMSKTFSILIIGLLAVFIVSCKKSNADLEPITENISKPASGYTSTMLHEYAALQLRIIPGTPGYETPLAARSLAYLSLAAYEAAVPGMPENESLSGKLEGFDNLPQIDKTLEYNWPIAVNAAEHALMKNIYGTTSDVFKIKIDTLKKKYEQIYKTGVGSDVIERSIRFGTEIAQSVWLYSTKDGGHLAYNNNFPISNDTFKGAAIWQPTGEEKRPLLPKWGEVRTFSKLNSSLKASPPEAFSFVNKSAFFEQASNVYEVSKSLNEEQKSIMKFWEMPNASYTQAGNQMALIAEILNKENYTLDKALLVYLKTSMAMHDAIVIAWKSKFENNLMRPQTYINQAIDPEWKALQAYSPVPDYVSEQASLVAAISAVLAQEFGENYVFVATSMVDRTRKRAYKNFSSYAKEAQVAPIYAGLHYKMSADEGTNQGTKIASNILAISLKKTVAETPAMNASILGF